MVEKRGQTGIARNLYSARAQVLPLNHLSTGQFLFSQTIRFYYLDNALYGKMFNRSLIIIRSSKVQII